jgi:hypothetical protein
MDNTQSLYIIFEYLTWKELRKLAPVSLLVDRIARKVIGARDLVPAEDAFKNCERSTEVYSVPNICLSTRRDELVEFIACKNRDVPCVVYAHGVRCIRKFNICYGCKDVYCSDHSTMLQCPYCYIFGPINFFCHSCYAKFVQCSDCGLSYCNSPVEDVCSGNHYRVCKVIMPLSQSCLSSGKSVLELSNRCK